MIDLLSFALSLSRSLSCLIPQSCKHERRSAVIVDLVYSKHHDQVLYDPRALAYCHRHVQWVGIVLGTETEGI